jgi:hypothetical protein
MLSEQGTQIVFTKMIWGTKYPAVATQIIGGWSTETLYQYPNAEYVMATSEYLDSTARFLFETYSGNGIYWVKNTDLNTVYNYPEVTLGFFAHGGQQICCRLGKSLHPGYIEPDATPPYFTAVSEDTIGAPFMWNDPETGHRLYMYRTNGYKTMKIFEETSPELWILYRSFDSPLPEKFPYITSPEPFVCGGHSYISFMAAQSESGKDGMPAEIWVAHVGTSDSLMRRVSDSTLAIRTDPEPVVFNDSAFVYYSHVMIDDLGTEKYVIRKCDTGLSNFSTVELEPAEEAGKLNVIPNPCSESFILQDNLWQQKKSLIRIFDLAGDIVFEQNITALPVKCNIQNLHPGIFILTLQGDSGIRRTKLQVVK